MDLKTFLSVLLVYRSNFHVMHWMAKGENFFTLHSKAEEYYNEILKDADVVAEMILRKSNKIVDYKEALDIISADENHEFLLVDSEITYDTDKFKKYSTKMFKDILVCIEELLEEDNNINIGMKSSLEAMYDKYDIICNYLLRRFEDD